MLSKDLFLYEVQVLKHFLLTLPNSTVLSLSAISIPRFLSNSTVILKSISLFSIVDFHKVLLNIIILLYSNYCY